MMKATTFIIYQRTKKPKNQNYLNQLRLKLFWNKEGKDTIYVSGYRPSI